MSSPPGAILVNIGYYLPFAIFVFMGFIRTIPRELEEAAAIDGASFRTFWQIVFPLLRPASASVLIFLGVWIWNDSHAPARPRAGNRQHDHRRHLSLDRQVSARFRLGLRLHVPRHAAGARLLPALPETFHPRPTGGATKG